ncbi:MAG: DUF3299 domain-containing protein [Planctomycetes bacterium]|nr:DUF3299 domain-containing protein [Planctomycetota bacterium]
MSTTEAAATTEADDDANASSLAPPRSTSLFAAPQPRAVDDYAGYRALSAPAVVSLVIGAISIVALLDFWALKAIPALGVIAAVAAIVQIRNRPEELTGLKQAKLGLALCGFFLIGSSAYAIVTHQLEVPEGYERISYGLLKNPDDNMQHVAPPAALELDGKRVFIKGYMFPPAHETGVTKFVLCRDNGDCCFGGQPPPCDMIFVDLQEGLDTTYNRRLRHVAGTFRVAKNDKNDVGKQVLYRLDADYIK